MHFEDWGRIGEYAGWRMRASEQLGKPSDSNVSRQPTTLFGGAGHSHAGVLTIAIILKETP
jgi:hypothetical protein